MGIVTPKQDNRKPLGILSMAIRKQLMAAALKKYGHVRVRMWAKNSKMVDLIDELCSSAAVLKALELKDNPDLLQQIKHKLRSVT